MARAPHDPGTAELAEMSPVTRRLLTANEEPAEDPAFLHAVLCQVAMPYRRTPSREWKHRNGRALLWMEAGAVEGEDDDIVRVPLPWGPKSRLVLAHLNAEALRQGERTIEVERTLHAFTKRIFGYAPNGRQLRDMKEHLTALSTATVRLSYRLEGGGRHQTQGHIVSGLELWDHTDERQQTLWPSQVTFSLEYWQSLVNHAVPLDMRHVGALSHSAMALDIYAWLSHRLHRVRYADGQFVPWSKIKEQFGSTYKRLPKFREVFRREFRQVMAVYPEARVYEEIANDGTPNGLRLHTSPPPVLRRG